MNTALTHFAASAFGAGFCVGLLVGFLAGIGAVWLVGAISKSLRGGFDFDLDEGDLEKDEF